RELSLTGKVRERKCEGLAADAQGDHAVVVKNPTEPICIGLFEAISRDGAIYAGGEIGQADAANGEALVGGIESHRNISRFSSADWRAAKTMRRLSAPS